MRPILIILLSMATLPSSAQLSIGLQAGIDNNYTTSDLGPLTYTKNSSENGFVLGAQISYPIKDWLSIKTGLTWLKKNYSTQRTGPYTGVYNTFTNDYLQWPVTACLGYTKKKWSLFANAGIYAGYWMGGRQKGVLPNIFSVTDSITGNNQTIETFGLVRFDDKYSFNTRKDQRFEFGLTPGAGIRYALDKNLDLGMEANYYHSLTNTQKHYATLQSSRINRTWALVLTCAWHIVPEKRRKK